MSFTIHEVCLPPEFFNKYPTLTYLEESTWFFNFYPTKIHCSGKNDEFDFIKTNFHLSKDVTWRRRLTHCVHSRVLNRTQRSFTINIYVSLPLGLHYISFSNFPLFSDIVLFKFNSYNLWYAQAIILSSHILYIPINHSCQKWDVIRYQHCIMHGAIQNGKHIRYIANLDGHKLIELWESSS